MFRVVTSFNWLDDRVEPRLPSEKERGGERAEGRERSRQGTEVTGTVAEG